MNVFNKEIEELRSQVSTNQRHINALELLQTIWVEVGPYGQDKLSEESLSKLNGMMCFDDSE